MVLSFKSFREDDLCFHCKHNHDAVYMYVSGRRRGVCAGSWRPREAAHEAVWGEGWHTLPPQPDTVWSEYLSFHSNFCQHSLQAERTDLLKRCALCRSSKINQIILFLVSKYFQLTNTVLYVCQSVQCVCVCVCVCFTFSNLCLNPCWCAHYFLVVLIILIIIFLSVYIMYAQFCLYFQCFEPEGRCFKNIHYYY